MLVEEIDIVGPEAFQAAIDSFPDMGRLAIDATMVHARVGIDVPTELGGDLHLIAERHEGFAHHHLVRERAIRLGGVKEIDAAFDRLANEGDHLRPILKFAGLAIAHAAQRESRYLETAVTEPALLHHDLLHLNKRSSGDSGAMALRPTAPGCFRASAPATMLVALPLHDAAAMLATIWQIT